MSGDIHKKMLQLRSKELNNEQNGPKLINKENINLGEIAINYLKGNEIIQIKNTSDEIIIFNQNKINEIDENYNSHVSNLTNPHKLSKSKINGLENVENTSDYEKPIPTILANELKNKMDVDELYDVTNINDNTNLSTRPTSASSGKIIKDTIDLYGGNWDENVQKIENRIKSLEDSLINYN